MRFLTIGAGALGGYYGGMLLRGGADVTFLVRPRRMAQLAERGLVIKTPDGEFRTPVKTVSAEGIDGTNDVVLVTCKAYDLDGAIADFAPALAPDGAVLPVMERHQPHRCAERPPGHGPGARRRGLIFGCADARGRHPETGRRQGADLVWRIDRCALGPVRGDRRCARNRWGSGHDQ